MNTYIPLVRWYTNLSSRDISLISNPPTDTCPNHPDQSCPTRVSSIHQTILANREKVENTSLTSGSTNVILDQCSSAVPRQLLFFIPVAVSPSSGEKYGPVSQGCDMRPGCGTRTRTTVEGEKVKESEKEKRATARRWRKRRRLANAANV